MAGVAVLEVLAPGILTTVQDLGRTGWARWGVAPSGAADPLSLRAANLLVGNPEGAAALETTLMGLRLRALGDIRAAVAGGDLAARLDGAPIPAGSAFDMRAGQVLAFAGPRRGFRAYLAVAGGLDVPAVLGSRATNLASGFGGYDGRPLRAGDRLFAGPAEACRQVPHDRRFDPGDLLPLDAAPFRLRVVWGPQDDYFTEPARAAFTGGLYRVSPESDRTGIRLEGPAIAGRPGAGESIISEGVLPGAVQVPGDGRPIILLRETATGGYRKIAVVIAADHPLLGQIKPGDEVRFEAVELEEAVAALRRMEEFLAAWASAAGDSSR
jgi:antagonist of KipI